MNQTSESTFPAVETARHNLTLARDIPSASRGNLPSQTRLYCRLSLSESVTGYGEAAPHPTHGPAISALESELARESGRPLETASAPALRMAGLDAAARRDQRPLWSYLGWPRPRPEIKTLLTFGGVDLDKLCRQISESNPAGIKLKLLGNTNDLEIVREVSRSFPGVPLALDVNGAWSLEQAGANLKRLESMARDLLWIEQPCVSLSSPLPTGLKILADEAVGAEDFNMDCYDGIVVKTARMHLEAAAGLMRAALDGGKLVTLGCHLQSSLLTQASLNLGGFLNTDWVDLDSELLVGDNPFAPPDVDARSGAIQPRDGFGLATQPVVDLDWRRH